MCQRLVCQKEFAVRLSSCEVKDPKFKPEIFMRIDMKHSYSQTISKFVCNQFVVYSCLNLTLYNVLVHRNILI